MRTSNANTRKSGKVLLSAKEITNPSIEESFDVKAQRQILREMWFEANDATDDNFAREAFKKLYEDLDDLLYRIEMKKLHYTGN